jgi:hypothetical protein
MPEKTEEIPLASISMDKAGIQDSFCYRALCQARFIAEAVVDEKGVMHPFPQPLLHSFYPLGTSDEVFWEQQNHFLNRWNQEPEFVKKFRRFSLPLCHRKAEEMVRASLRLPAKTSLTDAHVRRAAVSACLMPLRQTVGSCFGTAPAIIVQRYHLDLFVDDLYELLTRGWLRRVFEGKQYTVPMSLSFGMGDLGQTINPALEYWASPGLIAALETAEMIPSGIPFAEKEKKARALLAPAVRPSMKVEELLHAAVPPSKLEEAVISFKSTTDHALLKAWEFTLASFSDVKMEFSSWNLGVGLGLNPQEKNGIGEVLYKGLESKLQETNQKIEEYHQAAVEAFDQLKTVETLLKQAANEGEVRRLRAEGQARLHHLRSCEELRDEFQARAKVYANFFTFLVKQYTAKFQEYFQEIYDPEMPELFTGPYDDRMAGFRLVYKHGRSDSSVWTRINSPELFEKMLLDFFSVSEAPIMHSCGTAEEKKIVEEMTTLIIQHVQSGMFIQGVVARAAAIGRTPWAYLSGGTMEQLLPVYFRYSATKESREMQDELDLFIYLLETLKGLPSKTTQRFLEDPSRRLLIESPTHAFSLLPGEGLFKDGWTHEGFTYTWIRDKFFLPGQEFFSEMKLFREEQRELMRRLSLRGETSSSSSLEMFSAQCPQVPRQDLSAFLYRTLPLIRADECKTVLQKLLGTDRVALPSQMPDFFSSQEIQLMAKYQMKEDADRHGIIAARAKNLKLAPTACLFADTNWAQGYFSFVVDPLSLRLEIWKTDKTAGLGAPLPLVKSWLGKGKEFTWILFTNIF